jgi:hypothetical protein
MSERTPDRSDSPSVAVVPAVPTRRRLLKAGLAAAPVVAATLASRPVLGAPKGTASAGPSAGASVAPAKHASSGRSPEQWGETQTWPAPYCAADSSGAATVTLYHGSDTGLAGAAFAGSTMLAVMQLPDDDGVQTLGRYIGAALLNAREGLTPALGESAVRRMWNQFATQGYYEPVEGVRWDATDIVTYIRSTIA